MYVIFLDVDGVLNTDDSSRFPMVPVIGYPDMYFWTGDGLPRLDRKCVQAFNKFLKEATEKLGEEPKIVMSSTWRYPYKMDEISQEDWWEGMRAYMKQAGLHGTFVDYTPRKLSSTRGYEIYMWLSRTIWRKDRIEVKGFVCLDDDEYMAPVEGRTVKTNWLDGFTAEQVPEATRLLEEPFSYSDLERESGTKNEVNL